ncbi:MAG: acetyltransferase-like isoleucine patch superfamily enzyme [Crocinitomix sp.]|jgi:acetyltransferase-like isoleucine patch superfamily enzyme
MELVHYLWKQLAKIKNPSCTIRTARLGKNVKLGKQVTLEYGSSILANHIGDYTYINKFCLVDKNVSSIGKFCSIAYNVRIGLGGHPTDWLSTHPFAYNKSYGFTDKDIDWTTDSEETIVGNDVWIGANSTVLAGVKIGDGAIIGAHSLVNKDVEPYSIVVGVPAKHLRYRHSDEVIQKLLKTEWWNLPKEELSKRMQHLDNAEAFLNSL